MARTSVTGRDSMTERNPSSHCRTTELMKRPPGCREKVQAIRTSAQRKTASVLVRRTEVSRVQVWRIYHSPTTFPYPSPGGLP